MVNRYRNAISPPKLMHKEKGIGRAGRSASQRRTGHPDDEQRGLVDAPWPRVERGDADISRHQRVAIGAPQFCVLVNR